MPVPVFKIKLLAMRILTFFVLGLTSLFLQSGCSTQSQSSGNQLEQYFTYGDSIESAGVKMIPIHTPYGDFRVWTKRFGTNPRVKVLLLHGGPSMTHEYMECFETFFQRQGFELYEYDQLGSLYSDQPKNDSLWTIDRFVDEVDQVRQAIGADSSNFYLIGNSWGGILAMEYALKHQDHLKGMVVANMMASIPEYVQYFNNTLAPTIDPKALAQIKALEAAKDYANPRYEELLQEHYYNQHLCRLPEWPEPVTRSFIHANNHIYVLMQGPSEMGIPPEARLYGWDIKSRLKEISVPTLMVGARYDTMDPKAMEEQSKLVRNGRYLYCPNGSHLAMWDDQKVFMDGVIRFVRDVNDGKM